MLSLHVYETVPFCRMVHFHFPMVEITFPDISSNIAPSPLRGEGGGTVAGGEVGVLEEDRRAPPRPAPPRPAPPPAMEAVLLPRR